MTTRVPTPPDIFQSIDFRTGRPRFHFDGGAEGAAAAAAAAATATAAAAAAAGQKPWHDGVEPEILGHWQNKGWKVDDPREIALAATKQAREAERHFGVPVDRLLKLPDATAKPEEWAAVYQRLGAPKEAKEYDFAGITRGGKELDADFANALRESLAAAFVPKDKAKSIVEGFVKQLDNADAAQATITAGKLTTEKTDLATNWGTKFDFNMVQAREGAKRAGISEDGVKALQDQIGYAAVMEHFRKIGAATSEGIFHEGGSGSGVNTRAGAVSRLAELERDKAWGAKFKAGDATARSEWTALQAIIGGEAA